MQTLDNLTCNDDSQANLDHLTTLAQSLLKRAGQLGATECEVNCIQSRGLSVSVRLGQVETVESAHDRGVSLTVYVGHRKGSASTADISPASLEATVAQACAIARYTEEDSAAGLAEAQLMARDCPDLDLWHPARVTPEMALEKALTCEAAGRERDARIQNSDGATMATGSSVAVYANSHGFVGHERGTRYSLGCALIAGQAEQMQRDAWYTCGLALSDLQSPEHVGHTAADRTIARLQPRSLATQDCCVIFTPEMARTLIGHLLAAVSGGALYRRASFLLDSVGQTIFPSWMQIEECPRLPHGLRSAAFDAEGVATVQSPIVRDGIIQRYVLGSYSARKLGLKTTANAGGVHNLQVSANTDSLETIMKSVSSGLLVTELMGNGVNTVTGDYSRGAAGFWIENGQIAFPVDGVTIAGKLRTMFASIEAIGRDIDQRSSLHIGALLVGRMTVAGTS